MIGLSQTGNVVRVSAIITQLVFEHGLRIRVTAETSSSPVVTPAATAEGHSDATTPDSGSSAEIGVVSKNAGGSSEVTQGERSMTVGSSIMAKEKEDSPASDSGKEDGSRILVGKMSNLVTSDLDNLVDGKDILMLRLSPSGSPHTFWLMAISLSFVSSVAGHSMRLVLVQHPWLEHICRDGGDGRPLPRSWNHR